jgi:hypothetical protein
MRATAMQKPLKVTALANGKIKFALDVIEKRNNLNARIL